MDQQQEEKLRSLLEKWKDISDFQTLAVHLYELSLGDVRKLTGKYREADGVYGKACEAIFGENNFLHRYLLWNIWTSNKGDVRVSKRFNS